MNATPSRRHLHSVPRATRCGTHCARLCVDEGMASAMRADRGLLLWRATRSLGDSGLAEHAVQETFLRAWRACGSFDERAGTVRAWLLTISRNVLIDMARSRAVRPGDSHWDEVDDTIGARPGSADFTDSLADGMLVREILAQLPELHRNALVEVILRDRPYQEVADEMGVPVGTLKSRVHYALRSLRGTVGALAA